MILQTREVPPRVSFVLEQAGVHPLLARLLASRGVRSAAELDDSLALLLPPEHDEGCVGRWAACWPMPSSPATTCASWPTTTATAPPPAPWPCAAWRLLGAAKGSVHYVVPDRAIHGYGLTPAIVDLAMAHAAAVCW